MTQKLEAKIPKDGEGVEHFSIRDDGLWMYNAGAEAYCDLIVYPEEIVPFVLALVKKAPRVTAQQIDFENDSTQWKLLYAIKVIQEALEEGS